MADRGVGKQLSILARRVAIFCASFIAITESCNVVSGGNQGGFGLDSRCLCASFEKRFFFFPQRMSNAS